MTFLRRIRVRWWAIALVSLTIAIMSWAAPLSGWTPPSAQAQDTNLADVAPESELPARPTVAPDIQAIVDRGELIVAVLGKNNQPFFQEDSAETPCTTNPKRANEVVESDGIKLCGLDIELGKAIADELGVEVKFDRHAETFNEVVEHVFKHQADIAFSKISRTMKRVKNVSFSKPYVNMSQGLLVNRLELTRQSQGRQPIEVLRSLDGTIGVIQDSSYVGFSKQKFPAADVQEYPDWNAVVEAAREGEITAAYRDELEVKKIIRTYPDTALNFQTVALTDTNDAIAAVLPWDSSHLQEFVNQYLETKNADYTADALLDKYDYMFNTHDTTD